MGGLGYRGSGDGVFAVVIRFWGFGVFFACFILGKNGVFLKRVKEAVFEHFF